MNVKISLIALGAICSAVLFAAPNAGATEVKAEKKDVKTVTVTVKSGDTLTSIATKHKTTYMRIFDANKSIANPDMIDVGQKLRIPAKDEKLPKRFEKYQAVAAPVAYAPTQAQPTTYSSNTSSQSQLGTVYRGSTAGNTYYWGQCTWYAKNRRPDLPNMLGNGGQWVANAAARGYATGSTPRVGAVAEVPGHVMYVESVNKNGTITVSEMNYQGVGVVSTRTLPAANARYIY